MNKRECESCNVLKEVFEYKDMNVCLDCFPAEHIIRYKDAEIERLKRDLAAQEQRNKNLEIHLDNLIMH